ncbi:MAG: shikimate dehydrogenase [Clostridiales bacterium]|nr:shikimate dehydrogenase [Candidatus Cacconaster stercorequi]
MKKLCVIGDPVAHSLSPRIQQCMIDCTGAAYRYEIHPVACGELADFVAELRRGVWDGCNVTMPHKKAIVPLLDELTDAAAACGAVNTVRMDGGRVIGHNTDGQGFLDSLTARGFSVAGKRVLLLGAGGAGEAVAAALLGAGVEKLWICNRDLSRAAVLALRDPVRVEAIPFAHDAMCAAAGACDLLVNATPLGMSGKAAFADLRFLAQAGRDTVVYDLVYHPHCTLLLQEAERLGLQTVGGMELLIHQAMLSFAFFTGEAVDKAAMKQRIYQVL